MRELRSDERVFLRGQTPFSCLSAGGGSHMRRHSVTVLVTLLLASACVRKSELDQAQQENAQLRTQVTQLQQQVSELRGSLDAMTAKLSAAEATLARKPQMPVEIRFRPAMMGPGYVAVFSTTTKQDFPVLVTLKSKALGTSRQASLHLSHTTTVELGHAEGFTIEAGDEITLTNTNYEPLARVFTPPPS